MHEQQIIRECITLAGRRRALHRVWHGLWRGLCFAGLAWLLVLGAYKVFPLPLAVLGYGAIASLVIWFCFILRYWSKHESEAALASWLDQSGGFHERVATAVEFSQKDHNCTQEWSQLVMRDAAQAVARFDIRRALPFRMPVNSYWLLLVLTLGAGLGFVPEYRSSKHLEKQKQAEAIRESGKQLADFAKRRLTHPNIASNSATKESLESIKNLGEHLHQGTFSRSEALKDLANLHDKLKQETRQLAQSPSLKRMQNAAHNTGSPTSNPSPSLQKQIQDLQKQLEKQIKDTDALDKIKNDLEKAREAAAGMAGKPSSDSQQARDELGKALDSLAQQAANAGLAIPALQQAIEALAADKTGLLTRDLDVALKDLEKLQQLSQNLQQLMQQSERQARDLAEQLQAGQLALAKANLEKMEKNLEKAGATPQQVSQILEEVGRALDPAKTYGPVQDYLKQAVDSLKGKDQSTASQNLAKAARELEKLMGDMDGLSDLTASLAALERAQMCVGVGQCFGKGAPKGGKGNKPGRGFGTWADEEGWMDYPEISDLWENPPDNRGEMESRSRLADGTLAENLDPTRLRGKMSSGGSMPAITLKGISIKGISKAKLEESALAAQAEAQEALSQDNIPKAYQGAVKDYFDDLKK